jgi:HAE1 family hydrophobic/amphiphilic exporter-1
MLNWALHHRWQVVTSGWGILVFMILIVAPRIGFEFFPKSDQGQFTISVEMPAETSLAATNLVAKAIEDKVATIPEVESVFTDVGSSGSTFGGGEGSNLAKVTVALKRRRADCRSSWVRLCVKRI